MILVHEDDDCIHLYESTEAVALAIEALDAVDILRSVFDHTEQRYAIEWIKPNRKHWIGVSNGEYRLIPSGPPDPRALLDLLRSVSRTWPESDAPRVEALALELGRRLP